MKTLKSLVIPFPKKAIEAAQILQQSQHQDSEIKSAES
jgi:hypothetical protein